MKRSGTFLLYILLIAIVFGLSPSATAVPPDYTVRINGQVLTTSPGQEPQLVKNRIYLPLRLIGEKLGAQVTWDNNSRQVIITSPGHTAQPAPARSAEEQTVQIVIDGQVLKIEPDLGQPFINAAGRTMVPLRAVGTALGCQVDWDSATRTANIIQPTTTETTPTTTQPSSTTIPSTTDQGGTQPATPNPSTSALLDQLASYRTNLKLLDGSVINSSVLQGKSEASYSTQQIDQFKKYLTELRKYPTQITLPDGTVLNMSELTIKGESLATADQLCDWLAIQLLRVQQQILPNLNRQPISVPDLAATYLRIGKEYGIRGDLAFCQAAKETCYWQFTGSVKPEQNNYCGLYATGSPLTGTESLNGADPSQVSLQAGMHGATFITPEAGVEAHIQHLYAYACKDPLPAGKVLLDPRFALVSRGCSPTWLSLNARWAVPGTTYGQSIIQDYWLQALKTTTN